MRHGGRSSATGLLRVLSRSSVWTNASGQLLSAARAASSSGAVSNAPVVRHKLPAYDADQQEQRSLQHATEVIQRLKSSGALALIVGGWVRDKYLNRPSLDIDIATSASIEQVRSLFGRVTPLPRNTVKLHHHGDSFEVTQFRGMSCAADLHSAGLDAGMRDFTVNALFYDPLERTVLDFVGGVADLQRRELRLCVDPHARLAEDPLRALRAVRLAVSMGLKFPVETREAIQRMAHLCCSDKDIPPRRIWLELRKLNANEAKQPGSFANALKLCYRLGLLRGLLPFLDGDNALQQGVSVVEQLPGEMPLELRLAAMVNPNSKREVYEQASMYCQSAPERANVLALAQMYELPLVTSSSDQQALVGKYASEHAPLLLEIVAAWMRPEVSPQFRQHHQQRMHEWATDIAAVRERRQQHEQALLAEQRQARTQGAGGSVAASTSGSGADVLESHPDGRDAIAHPAQETNTATTHADGHSTRHKKKKKKKKSSSSIQDKQERGASSTNPSSSKSSHAPNAPAPQQEVLHAQQPVLHALACEPATV